MTMMVGWVYNDNDNDDAYASYMRACLSEQGVLLPLALFPLSRLYGKEEEGREKAETKGMHAVVSTCGTGLGAAFLPVL